MTIEIKYKYKKICRLCHNTYGSDHKHDNKICPKCSYNLRYPLNKRLSKKYENK